MIFLAHTEQVRMAHFIRLISAQLTVTTTVVFLCTHNHKRASASAGGVVPLCHFAQDTLGRLEDAFWASGF